VFQRLEEESSVSEPSVFVLDCSACPLRVCFSTVVWLSMDPYLHWLLSCKGFLLFTADSTFPLDSGCLGDDMFKVSFLCKLPKCFTVKLGSAVCNHPVRLPVSCKLGLHLSTERSGNRSMLRVCHGHVGSACDIIVSLCCSYEYSLHAEHWLT